MRRVLAAVLAMGLAVGGSAWAEPVGPAQQRVEDLHGVLLDVMKKATALGFQGRVEGLAPTLAASYNFPEMTRIAAGSFWKTFDDEQKRRLIEAFGRMSTAIYASRLHGATGGRFETLAVEPAPPPDTGLVITTRLTEDDGDQIQLVYRLRASGEDWRIIDLFHDGNVSELATQRSQYMSILKDGGYEALMRTLDQRIRDLAAGSKG